jgi:hypothetical protein
LATFRIQSEHTCSNKDGKTVLHCAVGKRNGNLVKLVLECGANVDDQDKDGRTALHIACQKGHQLIVTALLEHGCDVNIMSERNETALDFVVHMDHISSHRFGFVIKLDHVGKVFQRTAHILKCHIVKMKTANLFVSENNLRSLSNSVELSDFQNRCEEEIVRIKSEKFSNANVSFYDILSKGVSQLKMYAGNESIVQILRSDVCKVKFPIYASMINSNFRKGVRSKRLLEQGHEIFRSFFNNFPQLPHDCIEKNI